MVRFTAFVGEPRLADYMVTQARRIRGRRVSRSRPGVGFEYLLGMSAERAGELTGQISINELLIAMGEEPVMSMIDLTVPDDASSLTDDQPTLPGL
ncbi:hypothetical protein SRABI83_00377 [Arthrobacter sp. Bi83]|nr:hypothetical protein SRABI83_00377 [Arthrobacter sp. Bi83]